MDMRIPGEDLPLEVVEELSDGGKIDWKEVVVVVVG